MGQEQVEDLAGQLRAWRWQHPRATLTEIEAALDERMLALRAGLLEELAAASPAAGREGEKPAEEPRCPVCGGRVVRQGERERRLCTAGEQTITLRRGYATCSTCKAGFFPPG